MSGRVRPAGDEDRRTERDGEPRTPRSSSPIWPATQPSPRPREDEDAADPAGEFCETVREAADDYDAEAIKAIGDAIKIRGSDPARAIRLGLHVVNDVGGRHYWPTVRVAMHTGAATERGGDWFGSTVTLAARVSGVARGGEVLLTEATVAAAGPLDDVGLRQHGRHTLKKVSAPLLLYAAVRLGAGSDEGLPIDSGVQDGRRPRASRRPAHLRWRRVHVLLARLRAAIRRHAGPLRHTLSRAATRSPVPRRRRRGSRR